MEAIGIWRYRHALLNFVSQRLTIRYKRSFLGFLWSFLNPLFMILTYLFVFKYLITNPEPNYSVKLFCTILTWRFFNSAVMDSSASISSNLSLIKQINFPRIILPASSLIANLVDYVLSLSILVVVFAAARVTVNWPYLGLFLVALVILIIFAYGLGLILASLSIYYADIQFLVGSLFQMWFFLSPILYSASKVVKAVANRHLPPIVQTIYFCNPIAPLMMAFRSIIPEQVPTNAAQGGFPEYYTFLAISAGISLMIFFIGLMVFKRGEKSFAKQV